VSERRSRPDIALAAQRNGAVVVGVGREIEGMMLAESVTVTANATEIMRGDVAGGPSTSQTIMVSSLQRLLSLLPPDASADAYRSVVMQENVLGKRTASGREWAFRQLRRFYALDAHSLLFRALRDLWADDPSGQPLLAYSVPSLETPSSGRVPRSSLAPSQVKWSGQPTSIRPSKLRSLAPTKATPGGQPPKKSHRPGISQGISMQRSPPARCGPKSIRHRPQ
jgi:hypothetical protein